MPVATNQGGGSFQLAPAGTHPARCIWVIDLGTQRDEFMGKPKLIRKVRIGWELPLEKAVFNEERGEESFMCGQDYTLSLGERANLRHMLESWRGRDFTEQELKGFDLKVLVGKACMVNIIHKKSRNKRDYAQVASVTPLPKGMTCPPVTLTKLVFDIPDGENEVFQALPEWIQEKILDCEEWNADPGSDGGEEWPDEEQPQAPPPPQEPARRRKPSEPEAHKQAQPSPRKPAPPPPLDEAYDPEDEIPF